MEKCNRQHREVGKRSVVPSNEVVKPPPGNNTEGGRGGVIRAKLSVFYRLQKEEVSAGRANPFTPGSVSDVSFSGPPAASRPVCQQHPVLSTTVVHMYAVVLLEYSCVSAQKAFMSTLLIHKAAGCITHFFYETCLPK